MKPGEGNHSRQARQPLSGSPALASHQAAGRLAEPAGGQESEFEAEATVCPRLCRRWDCRPRTQQEARQAECWKGPRARAHALAQRLFKQALPVKGKK